MENVAEMQAQLEESKRSRRSALLMGGAALAGLALSRNASAQAAVTDNDILNFALNLEYLEAQFYTLATAGVTIDDASIGGSISGVGTAGKVSVKTNPKVPFTTKVLQAYAMETAQEERNHVKFLQGALGSAAVAMPNIDLMASFQALATAAGIPNASTFDPFASETNFLLGAFIFEDVGVTAYHGAAASISNGTYLDAAAGILAVEAYHAGSIRTRIYAAGATAQGYSQMIANTRAKLSGAATADDYGVGANGSASIVDADVNAIAFARTTTQVLNIVYGGSAATPGAFFPNGLNGTINK